MQIPNSFPRQLCFSSERVLGNKTQRTRTTIISPCARISFFCFFFFVVTHAKFRERHEEKSKRINMWILYISYIKYKSKGIEPEKYNKTWNTNANVKQCIFCGPPASCVYFIVCASFAFAIIHFGLLVCSACRFCRMPALLLLLLLQKLANGIWVVAIAMLHFVVMPRSHTHTTHRRTQIVRSNPLSKYPNKNSRALRVNRSTYVSSARSTYPRVLHVLKA